MVQNCCVFGSRFYGFYDRFAQSIRSMSAESQYGQFKSGSSTEYENVRPQ
ncbi:hypothetical protein ACFFQF_15205 [Haladaptatus pallidirubidus]